MARKYKVVAGVKAGEEYVLQYFCNNYELPSIIRNVVETVTGVDIFIIDLGEDRENT